MMAKLPGPLEIYPLLPGTNCKDCGEANCMAFATKMAEHTGRTIDDCIDVLFSDIDFDSLEIWAKALEVDVEYPTDDMWPDWEAELSVKTGEALLRAVRFNIHTDICPTCKDKQQRNEFRRALEHIEEYWNRDENQGAMSDALWHIIETVEAALSKNQPAQEKVEK